MCRDGALMGKKPSLSCRWVEFRPKNGGKFHLFLEKGYEIDHSHKIKLHDHANDFLSVVRNETLF